MTNQESGRSRKGHWPAGRRRHAAIGGDEAASLARWLARVARGDEPDLSLRGIARALGVSDRAVRRWMAREDWPAPRHAAALRLLIEGQPVLRELAARRHRYEETP